MALLEMHHLHLRGLGYVKFVLVLAIIDVTVQQLTQFQGLNEELPLATMHWNKVKVLRLIGQTQTIISKMFNTGFTTLL